MNVTILTKGSCEGPTEKLSLESAAHLSLMELYCEVKFCVYCSFTALVHTMFPFCFWPKKKSKIHITSTTYTCSSPKSRWRTPAEQKEFNGQRAKYFAQELVEKRENIGQLQENDTVDVPLKFWMFK